MFPLNVKEIQGKQILRIKYKRKQSRLLILNIVLHKLSIFFLNVFLDSYSEKLSSHCTGRSQMF